MRCLSFFYYFAKEPMGISGKILSCVGEQFGTLRLWSAGSFGKAPIRSINVTPDYQRKISVAEREVMILL